MVWLYIRYYLFLWFFSLTFSLRYKNFCIVKGFCFSGCQGDCSPVSNGASYSCPCDANQTPFIPSPYDQCPYYCYSSTPCACSYPPTNSSTPPSSTTDSHSGMWRIFLLDLYVFRTSERWNSATGFVKKTTGYWERGLIFRSLINLNFALIGESAAWCQSYG